MFIIPNALVKWDELLPSAREDLSRRLQNLGIEPGSGPLVQVWWTNGDCDNWVSHRWDAQPELFSNISSHLPVSLFEGKVEGDKIRFTLSRAQAQIGEHYLDQPCEVEIEVELRQLGFRYQWAGKFEEALQRLLDAHGRVGI
jgi:hypothetical protein